MGVAAHDIVFAERSRSGPFARAVPLPGAERPLLAIACRKLRRRHSRRAHLLNSAFAARNKQ
jgi:hypothetical protein